MANYSKAELDEMIGECIKAVENGTVLPREKKKQFFGLLEKIGKSKGIAWEKCTQHSFIAFSTPQAILSDAINLDVIRKPEHKEFIVKARTLIRIETSLLSLAHIFPNQFWEYAWGQYNKPMAERWKNISKLSGLNFQRLFDLERKQGQLNKKMKSAKKPDEKAKLEKQYKRANIKQAKEVNGLVASIKGLIAAKFTRPDYRAKLKKDLKNERNELSDKDMDKLWRTLENYDKNPPKTVRRKRPM